MYFGATFKTHSQSGMKEWYTAHELKSWKCNMKCESDRFLIQPSYLPETIHDKIAQFNGQDWAARVIQRYRLDDAFTACL